MISTHRSFLCLLLLSAILPAATPLLSNPAPARGPLRVHPQNPRYFTDGTTNADGSLKAVYLGGHEIFVDLQDNAFNKEWTKDMSHPDDPAAKARLLDWERYLDWIEGTAIQLSAQLDHLVHRVRDCRPAEQGRQSHAFFANRPRQRERREAEVRPAPFRRGFFQASCAPMRARYRSAASISR